MSIVNDHLNVHTVNSQTSSSWQEEQETPPSQEIKLPLDIRAIRELLPHRYPFALVDRIIEYIPSQKAVGIKNVTINEPFFAVHIPPYPIMPGVLIVEAMAQVGGIILTLLPGMQGEFFAFGGLDKVRFRRPVVPGDQIVITVELISFKLNRIAKMQGKGTVDGQVVVEGEMLFSRFEY